ncbi:MAG: glycine--tRNA ligase [Candidatus Wildermuthbacteria bacterium RIFCSPLOWO2_12_FULL_40_9]|uniref:glycine--tRNA ligase n=2 Tax=Candidatus Wildermuthiibacteriota TaxID=1817923 RepID=A0A1G2REX3_9BACT|nr:MAG: glycine--tRNA ligase [Candidatus Wildermuthbacteria bacterium RIFCSPHIGHO2_12_FULL_40_12]OHA76950.1 MAG: glycine--tRNA ligase [Candidatus Wildermuthbacteria bacterium RIFCSPLOWO2_12_FULL_40_9]
MEKIVALCKRRGFIFPGFEIYGGLANSWDFGPLGVELKNNIKNLWWERFVRQRDDVIGLDSAIITNSKVWEASGHLKEFSDPLVECKKCHERFRIEDIKDQGGCLECGSELTVAKMFNLMFKTNLGPTEGDTVYLRPETAQGMFVDFKNILDSAGRRPLPFGIAQIGKAFRNEITPGNFIFRTREFEMMEIEYFVREKDWENSFEGWRVEMRDWMEEIGIDAKKIHETEVPESERAHYSKKTIDFEYDFPFGKKELYGLAYRGDFDLKNHEKASGKNLKYRDPDTGEEILPYVVEPTWGVERTVLALLDSSYYEEKDRTVLKLKPCLAPYKAAVFPLLANKPKLVELARKVYEDLQKEIFAVWDDRGNIGKRYYSQDEIGTPFCVTVDFDSLEKKDATVRDRDTAKQERVKIKDLSVFLKEKLQN